MLPITSDHQIWLEYYSNLQYHQCTTPQQQVLQRHEQLYYKWVGQKH